MRAAESPGWKEKSNSSIVRRMGKRAMLIRAWTERSALAATSTSMRRATKAV